MTKTPQPGKIGVNRATAALDVCIDALEPLIRLMPEGGLVGKARAHILACRMQLIAARNELSFGDAEDTPAVRSPSQMMAAVKAGGSAGVSGVRGIAARTQEILEGGKGKT